MFFVYNINKAFVSLAYMYGCILTF